MSSRQNGSNFLHLDPVQTSIPSDLIWVNLVTQEEAPITVNSDGDNRRLARGVMEWKITACLI